MGKLTISMAIFNSYVKLPEGSSTAMNLLGRATWGSIRTVNERSHVLQGQDCPAKITRH